MEETISASDANRRFSHLLGEVRNGKRFVITSHGEPVAELGPADKDRISRQKAWDQLMEHLHTRPVIDVGPWTRDELYDND